MRIRIELGLPLAACLLFLPGCISGVLDSDVARSADADPGCRFVIEKITYEGNEVIDWHDDYFAFINAQKLSEVAADRYHLLFSRTKKAGDIPVTVAVRQKPEKLNYWVDGSIACGQMIYFMPSLGILPMYVPMITYAFDVDLIFQSRWGNEIFTAKDAFETSERFWLCSLPYVWCFYAGGGKFKYSGTVSGDDLRQRKAIFIAETISDSVARTILSNRKQIKQKILLAEVENRWSILVGLESADSLFAADDAGEWRRWMTENGWNAERIRQLTGKKVLKNDLEGVFENFLGNATGNDLVVLMWSGDVYADPARPDDVYLACRDTDPKAPWTGYRLADLFKALKENRASKVVLLLDVCNGSGKKLLTREYLKKLGPLPDWMLIVNESAKRGDDRSSGVLARLLPEGLDGKADSDGDRLVTLKELAAWLKSGSADHGDLMVWMPAESSKLPEFPLSNR